MSNVLVWSEDANLRGELCAKAGSLGSVHETNATGTSDAIAAGLAEAAGKIGADLVLIGHTKQGVDVGPRVAAALDASFAANCMELSGTAGNVTVGRMVLSGNSKATYTMAGKAVVSVAAKVFDGKASGTPAQVQAPAGKVTVTSKKPVEHGDVDLPSAPVVVGVGRGFKQQADLKLAEELAKCFPGGAVGCSRPIAADLKWLGEEHWIGLSGNQIKPKAYIACGVSGQIQHVAGIRGAKLIIAINTNKDAPIFQVSDYGIVGDLYQVIPKLVALLKK